MPEGPEIRRAAMRLDKVLAGQPLAEVTFGQPHLERWGPRLTGATVTGVTSRSKALLTRLDTGYTIYSHNQLYGRWYVTRRPKLPQTNRTLRLALHTASHSALLYSASDIHVLDDLEVPDHPYIAKLGPEALDEETTWQDIRDQLMSKPFQGRQLSALYLDQSFVAGIGNYLRSEILHEAKLHPSLAPKHLSRGEAGRLARATLKITRRALATAGVTNPPSRVRRLQNSGHSRAAYRFAVFGRTAAPCYTCSTPIDRISANSRRLYLCSACQPRP